ncbi:MAG: hypothetical protein M1826_000296 [Phylliscum demangeonii]|nr:MAG: hypothetical protein M1826_000296 [Phylliscum demangeonii]
MPGPVLSGASVCLRCETRLLKFVKATTALRPRYTRFSSSAAAVPTADDPHPVLPSQQLVRSVDPLKGLQARGVISEYAANLKNPWLGAQTDIVVLRNVDLPPLSRIEPAHSAAPRRSEHAKKVEPVSALDVVAALKSEKESLRDEDVTANIERLLDKRRDQVLSEDGFNELAAQLRDGFTSAQLAQYIRAYKGERRSMASMKELRWTNEESIGLQYASWRPGVTSFDGIGDGRRKLAGLAGHEKDRLVTTILNRCWNVLSSEVVGSSGELDITLAPLQVSLLLDDRRDLLRAISEKRMVKLDVRRSTGHVRVTGDEGRAEGALQDIRALLQQRVCLLVNLKTLSAATGKTTRLTDIVGDDSFREIGQATGVEMERLEDGKKVAIHTLDPSMAAADDALRLLLGGLQPRPKTRKYVLCSGPVKLEKIAVTSMGYVNDLPWHERGSSWFRLALPVAKRPPGKIPEWKKAKERRPTFARKQQLFAQAMEGFLVDGGAFPLIRQYSLQPVTDPTGTQQDARWNVAPEFSTTAAVGYGLKEEKNMPRSPLRPTPAPTPAGRPPETVWRRTFSYDVPGLRRFVGLFPPDTTQPGGALAAGETLVIHLRPSPWFPPSPPSSGPTPSHAQPWSPPSPPSSASKSSNRSPTYSPPPIELTVSVNPIFNEYILTSVTAVLDQRIVDVLLPERPADLRFVRRGTVSLTNPEKSRALTDFIANSQLDERDGKRLVTPSELKIMVPKWWTGASPEQTDARRNVDPEMIEAVYLFAGVERRQTLHLTNELAWKAQYRVIDGGATGGRRAEFHLFQRPVDAAMAVGDEEALSVRKGGRHLDLQLLLGAAVRVVDRLDDHLHSVDP